MAPSEKSRTWHGDQIVLGALATVGILISAYMTWVHYAGIAPICVGGKGGCETVQSSSYATIVGVPVAVLGLLGYAGLLFFAVWRSEMGVYSGFLISIIGTLFSAYLTYLEVFEIHALCQ